MVNSGQETSARTTTSVGDAGATADLACNSEKVNTGSEEFLTALWRLNETLTEKNIEALKKIEKMTGPWVPRNERLSDDQILVGIGVHLIKKLTGRAETTLKRSQIECPCKCGGKLDCSNHMYIGSEDTLHGELDMLSMGVGVSATESISDETQGTDDGVDETETEPAGSEEKEPAKVKLVKQSSNGHRANLEFKNVSTDETPGHQQLIAQAITFGWTQYNRHRDSSPYIPTLYIDSTKFGLFVYNPVLDSLFISETPLLFIADKLKSSVDKYSGIFILWLILYHRLFFERSTDYDKKGFDCKFTEQVKVEFYKQLKEYSSCIKRHTPGAQWGAGDIGIWESKLEQHRKRKHSDSD